MAAKTIESAYALLAKRCVRDAQRAIKRAYKKAVRTLAEDADIDETEAARHLAEAGLTEPKAD